MQNERRLHNWRTRWKSQRDTLRKYAHTPYNQCHHRSPAPSGAFAFPEPAMTQLILGFGLRDTVGASQEAPVANGWIPDQAELSRQRELPHD